MHTQIYVSHSNQFQNYKFWILANYYSKIDLEILAPESLSETQTNNELIQLNIETTNLVFTHFKVQYR